MIGGNDMVRCPRCGYEFDLKRANKVGQIIEYISANNGVELKTLHHYFRKKWSCSGNIITTILKKLGREKIISVHNSTIYMTDEWLLKQKKL